MDDKKTIRIGLLGIGTIGGGVVAIIKEEAQRIQQQKGVMLELAGIADLSQDAFDALDLNDVYFTKNASDLINDPKIDIIVELIGGIKPAEEFVVNALKKGKDVVTANKKLLAVCGTKIFATAAQHKTDIRFEAAVCGGIPIIRSITSGLIADQFETLYGIVNGTTNYILTRMEEAQLDFMTAVKEAQEKGFAEADYTLDTNGEDAAQKIAILARIAFGCDFPQKNILCEGIETITSEDIAWATEFGYRIKLLAIIRKVNKGLEVRVHPAMIPSDSSLAGVRNEFNAVQLCGDRTGDLLLYGRGAGRYPTASAVVGDIVELACRRLNDTPSTAKSYTIANNPFSLIPASATKQQYYLRFGVDDRSGVLEKIAKILADKQISIASVIQQKKVAGSTVFITMVTHVSEEKTVQEAVNKINALDVVSDNANLIRIVELS